MHQNPEGDRTTTPGTTTLGTITPGVTAPGATTLYDNYPFGTTTPKDKYKFLSLNYVLNVKYHLLMFEEKFISIIISA